MGVYKPQVQCRGALHDPASCGDVLADMPASTEVELFGPRESPHVEQLLPQELVSGMSPTRLLLDLFFFPLDFSFLCFFAVLDEVVEEEDL